MKFDKGCLLKDPKENTFHFIIKNKPTNTTTFYVTLHKITIFQESNDKGFLGWKVYKNGEFINQI